MSSNFTKVSPTVLRAPIPESYLDLTSTGLAIDQVQSNLDTAEADLYIEVENKILGSYITGLEISNNTIDSEHDIDIAPGFCKDDTFAYLLELTSTLTKRIDASWAVGDDQGGRAIEIFGFDGTSPVVFESAISSYISVTALSDTKAIVCYRDGGNSNYGTACLLNISTGSIVSGTPVVFESASTDYISVTTLSETKAIVCYRDVGNSNYGTACILDVSTGSIVPNTPVVFELDNTNYISVIALSETKAIVCYADAGNGFYGTSCLLDISTGSIVPDTPVIFELDSAGYTSVTSLSETKAIVCYRDEGNGNYGTACLLDVSTGSIVPDTPVVFESAPSSYISVISLSETKAIVCYSDLGSSGYGTSCLLDISTGIIVSGAPVVFESAISSYISVTALSETKAIVCYRDDGNSNYGTSCILDISSGSIVSYNSSVFESASTNYISVISLSETKVIVCYSDLGNSSYGTSALLEPAILPDTWYYIFLIRKDSDGSTDVLLSASKTSPAMPNGYTYKRRLRGAILTNSSSNIYQFRQRDNFFTYVDVMMDLNSTINNTSRTLFNVSVPPNMMGYFIITFLENSGPWYIWIRETYCTDAAASATNHDCITSNTYTGTGKMIEADSSSQIAYRANSGNNLINVFCKGFWDNAEI